MIIKCSRLQGAGFQFYPLLPCVCVCVWGGGGGGGKGSLERTFLQQEKPEISDHIKGSKLHPHTLRQRGIISWVWGVVVTIQQ